MNISKSNVIIFSASSFGQLSVELLSILCVFGLCRNSILLCDIGRTVLGGVGEDFAQTTIFRGGFSIETIHSMSQLDGQCFELVESAELWDNTERCRMF